MVSVIFAPCQKITIQTGGTLNGLFLREKLFDYIDIVVAPVLIGGKDTSTLIDGKSLLLDSELSHLGVLKLQDCIVLEDSYLRLRYKVIRLPASHLLGHQAECQIGIPNMQENRDTDAFIAAYISWLSPLNLL